MSLINSRRPLLPETLALRVSSGPFSAAAVCARVSWRPSALLLINRGFGLHPA